MNIGQAATASGVSTKLIRYYERIGLVKSPARTHGNYREFGPRDIDELRFIRLARALCFSVAEISDLLSLWRDRSLPAQDVKSIAEAYLIRLEARAAAVEQVSDALRVLSTHAATSDRPDSPNFPAGAPPTIF